MKFSYIIIALFAILGCAKTTNDEIIVLINVEQFEEEPENMAKGISTLSSLSPKVIGIDFRFAEDIGSNKELIAALKQCKNLVMSTEIDNYRERLEEYPTLRSIPTKLLPPQAKTGFVSLIEEEDAFITVKKFACCEKVSGKTEYQFGVQTALLYDSMKTSGFVKAHPKINDVNFHSSKKFKSFEMIDIINGKVKREDIEGKIVLLGYLGPGFTDKFFSGAIKRGSGSFDPDMYAIELHAHVITQVLSE